MEHSERRAIGHVSNGEVSVLAFASGRMRAFFHSDGKTALVIDAFMSWVKFERAVLAVSLNMSVEMPSRPEALDEERFITWRTSLSVTGRRENWR